VRHEQAQWRLSAVLLTLVLALGAAVYHIGDADRSALGARHRSPSAVMTADVVSASATADGRQRQARLASVPGHGVLPLFVMALAALLAGLRRPDGWSLTASLEWLLRAAVDVLVSRGRAPPAPMRFV
jgi:hypothetical protein